MSSFKEMPTVVQGEASESDDDEQEPGNTDVHSSSTQSPHTNHDNDKNLLQSPMSQSVVISGEASESDEEFQDITVPLSPSEPGKLPKLHVKIEPEKKVQRPLLKKINVDSLLHKKLREKNQELSTEIENHIKGLYSGATRDISLIAQQLGKSQSAIQDVSHIMRLATNDLFHLEDKLDIITTCNLLPNFVGQRTTQLEAAGGLANPSAS